MPKNKNGDGGKLLGRFHNASRESASYKHHPATSFDPAAVLYFTAASITSSAEKTAVSNFFATLRANSILPKIAMLGLSSPTSSTAALIDAVRLTSFTNVNNATWGSDGSWTFNGTSSYLNSNFDPGASAIVTATSATLYIVSKNTNPSGTAVMLGCNDGTNQANLFLNTTTMKTRFYQSGTETSYVPTDLARRFCGSRASSVLHEGYENAVLKNTNAGTNSNVRPSGRNLYIGAYNDAGTATFLTSMKTTVFMMGSGFSAADVSIFDGAVVALDTALGR